MDAHQTLTLVADVLLDAFTEFDRSGVAFSALRLDEFNLRHLAMEKLQSVRGYACDFNPACSRTVRKVLVARSQTEGDLRQRCEDAVATFKEALAGATLTLQQLESDQPAGDGAQPPRPCPSEDALMSIQTLRGQAGQIEQAAHALSSLYQFRDQEFTSVLDLLASHSVTDALPRAHQAVQQSGHGDDQILVLEARALLTSARRLDDELASLHRVHSGHRSRLAKANELFTAMIEDIGAGSKRHNLAPDDLKKLFSDFCDGRIGLSTVKDALKADGFAALQNIGEIVEGIGTLIDIGDIAGDVASGIGKAIMGILE